MIFATRFLVLAVCICPAVGGFAGHCAFTCSRQNKTFINHATGNMLTVKTDDPSTRVKTYPNGSLIFEFQCYARSGPFFALRRVAEGNVFEYNCFKDPIYDTTNDITVFFVGKWRPLAGNPTICDVCNGKDLAGAGVLVDKSVTDCRVELGCNIPTVCAVTDPATQERCPPCTPSQGYDDGLDCNCPA